MFIDNITMWITVDVKSHKQSVSNIQQSIQHITVHDSDMYVYYVYLKDKWRVINGNDGQYISTYYTIYTQLHAGEYFYSIFLNSPTPNKNQFSYAPANAKLKL